MAWLIPPWPSTASRKLGREDAAALAKAASSVIVCKGKKVDTFKPEGKAPKALVDAMLGPTGNLRAPTMRIGKSVFVGFNEQTFSERLLYYLDRKKIKFVIDDIACEDCSQMMTGLATRYGYSLETGESFDPYLYPRFDTQANPMGTFSF